MLEKIKITMVDYLNKIIEEFIEIIEGESKSPIVNHLYINNLEILRLDKAKKILFHHVTIQLLQESQRDRLDILFLVNFFTIRVNRVENDWRKIK